MHQGSKEDVHSSQEERELSVIDYSTTSDSTATPAGIYLFKVNDRNTRGWCEICSKLTIKAKQASKQMRCKPVDLAKQIQMRHKLPQIPLLPRQTKEQ